MSPRKLSQLGGLHISENIGLGGWAEQPAGAAEITKVMHAVTPAAGLMVTLDLPIQRRGELRRCGEEAMQRIQCDVKKHRKVRAARTAQAGNSRGVRASKYGVSEPRKGYNVGSARRNVKEPNYKTRDTL